MKKIFIPVSAAIISLALFIAPSDSCLDKWHQFSYTPEKAKLTKWIRSTAQNILNKKKSVEPDFVFPATSDCTGLFITFISKGKVRGCFGAFNHTSGSTSEILREYIKGALTLDPRYRPLDKSELDETEIILTVASDPEPVDSINNVDISNFGLFIECDDSSKTVIVPAEYRTTSRVMKLTGNSQCRFYKFKAVTVR